MRYDPFEINDMLKRAVLLVDTREQDTPAYRQRLQQIAMPYYREKLDAGDYGIRTTDDTGRVIDAHTVIERKMSLDELCTCFTSERSRFRREFERASASGTKVWLLVEDASWAQMLHGQYRSKMHPNALQGSVFSWAARYGISIVMCRSADAAVLIGNILYHALKHELEVMDDEGADRDSADVDGRIQPAG